MQHLTFEELAGMVDEVGTESQLEHVQSCGRCAGELDRLREQTLALADLRTAQPPATLWPALEARLHQEGLVGRPRGVGTSHLLRAAAAAALFLLGSLTGGVVVSVIGDEPAVATNTATRTEAPLTPSDATEAAVNLQLAEAEYLNAVSDFATLTGGGDALDPVSRLAALEGILLTTQAALREAPADPIINNYHLTALGLRDALLRELEGLDSEQWY